MDPADSSGLLSNRRRSSSDLLAARKAYQLQLAQKQVQVRRKSSVSKRPSLLEIHEGEEEPPKIETVEEAVATLFRRTLKTNPIYETNKDFKVQLSDIFIASFPCSGSVWVQNIIHQLRTKGDGSQFDEISYVIPYVTNKHELGDWEHVGREYSRRVFKTHMPANKALEYGSCRYIYVCRNAVDVLVSHYIYLTNVACIDDAVLPIDVFYWQFFRNKLYPSYWEMITSWWRRRTQWNVMMILYEDICEDLEGSIKRIAHFANMEPDEDSVYSNVYARCKPAYMLAHVSRYDDHSLNMYLRTLCGVSPFEQNLPLISHCDVGTKEQRDDDDPRFALKDALSKEIIEDLQKVWNERVSPTVGFNSYEEMRAGIGDERRRQ